jgi:tartrate dehydratase beta subunit/fumarate hydratase class I family protein
MRHPISRNDVSVSSAIKESQLFDRGAHASSPVDAAKHVVAFASLVGTATKRHIMDGNPTLSRRTVERVLQKLQAEGAIDLALAKSGRQAPTSSTKRPDARTITSRGWDAQV